MCKANSRPTSREQSVSGRWLLATLAAVGSVQAGFLLLPGPFWDGWIYQLLFERGERDAFLAPFVLNGRPLGGWVLWLTMDTLGVIAGPKLLAALSLVGAAAALYGALRLRDLLDPRYAFLVATIATTIPATQTVLASSALQFFLGFFAFYAGLYAFVVADTVSRAKRVLGYAAALVLATLSVLLAEAPLALLPIYPFSLVVSREGWDRIDRHNLWRYRGVLMRHSAPVAVGAMALMATFAVYPTSGPYENAHRVSADPLELLFVGGLFAVALLAYILPLVVARLWLVAGWRNGRWMPPMRTLVPGAVALLLGISPYLAAGRWPSVLGWGTRTLLFSGLGLGLIAWALLRYWEPLMDPKRSRAAVIAVCIAALAATLWRLPLWAARQVKDDGIALALRAQSQSALPGLLWIDDRNWSIASPYRDYEWTALVQQATGRRDLLGLSRDANEGARLAEALRDLQAVHALLARAPDTTCAADVMVDRLPFGWPAVAMVGVLVRAFSPQEQYWEWLQGRVPVRLSLRNACGA